MNWYLKAEKIAGILQTFANKCLTVATSERLAQRPAVAVEYNDVLFIGEVVCCTPEVGDQWEVDVKVAHTLTGLQKLMILRAQLEQHQTVREDVSTEAMRK